MNIALTKPHIPYQNESRGPKKTVYVNCSYNHRFVLCSFILLFSARPLLQPEILFQLSSYGAEQRKSLKILHSFTDKVGVLLYYIY